MQLCHCAERIQQEMYFPPRDLPGFICQNVPGILLLMQLVCFFFFQAELKRLGTVLLSYL